MTSPARSSRPVGPPLLALSLSLSLLALNVGCSEDPSPRPSDVGVEAPPTIFEGAVDMQPVVDTFDMDLSDEDGGVGVAIEEVFDQAPPEPDKDPLEALLEVGPYSVGYHSERISYTPSASALGGERSLRLSWWFPSDQTGGERLRYRGLLDSPYASAERDPSGAIERAPVLVFSHGNRGFSEQSFFFTEYLASHGWVVVAMDHTGNTLLGGSLPMHLFFELRPIDVSAVITHLTELPSDHKLAGYLNTDKLALAGHSFGGYTTLAVGGATYDLDTLTALCQAPPPAQAAACAYTLEAAARYEQGFADPRVKALIPMTPAGATLFDPALGTGAIELPTLMMTAGRDLTLPNEREGDPLWSNVSAEGSLRVDLTEAGHFTYSDACDVPGDLIQGDGCGADNLALPRAHQLINAYALAFLKARLLSEAGYEDLLSGAVHLDAEAPNQLTLELVE